MIDRIGMGNGDGMRRGQGRERGGAGDAEVSSANSFSSFSFPPSRLLLFLLTAPDSLPLTFLNTLSVLVKSRVLCLP